MKTTYIELAGQKYPLRFTFAAAERISEEFGSMDNMSAELTDENTGRSVDALNKVLTILLDAGRFCATACGEETPPELTCRPVDLLDAWDTDVLKAIFGVIKGDTEREVEVEAKNGEVTGEGAAPRGSTTAEAAPD